MVSSPNSQIVGRGHSQQLWWGTLQMSSPLGLPLALLPSGEEEGTWPGWEDGVLGIGRWACGHRKLPSQSFSTCGSRHPSQALAHEALHLLLLLSTAHAAPSGQPSWGASAPAPFSCCGMDESGDSFGVNHALALPRGHTVRVPAPNKFTPISELKRWVVCLLCVCIFVCVCVLICLCVCVFVSVPSYMCVLCLCVCVSL